MGKIRSFLRNEKGAAQMVEAAIIYPVVFLFIAFLIYLGLYILQCMSVSAYAQKVGMLAAREIAYPGYIDLVSGSPYSNAAVEADLSDAGDSFDNIINLTFDTDEIQVRAYRYWGDDPLDGYVAPFKSILTEMVNKNSIIGAKDAVDVNISCDNYFIVQYVNVTVSQPLMDFPLLDFWGIHSPTVKATVKTSANDTDEFVRNTDFAVDALEAIANKLGIDVNGLKQKVQDAKTKLNLN